MISAVKIWWICWQNRFGWQIQNPKRDYSESRIHVWPLPFTPSNDTKSQIADGQLKYFCLFQSNKLLSERVRGIHSALGYSKDTPTGIPMIVFESAYPHFPRRWINLPTRRWSCSRSMKTLRKHRQCDESYKFPCCLTQIHPSPGVFTHRLRTPGLRPVHLIVNLFRTLPTETQA